MDALTAIMIAVGGSLIVIVISQIQNRRIRERSGGSAGSDGGAYAGGTDSGSDFFSWSDGSHGGSSHSPGFDASAEATAVEAMVGEAVAAEAISGRRYFTRPAWPLDYSEAF